MPAGEDHAVARTPARARRPRRSRTPTTWRCGRGATWPTGWGRDASLVARVLAAGGDPSHLGRPDQARRRPHRGGRADRRPGPPRSRHRHRGAPADGDVGPRRGGACRPVRGRPRGVHQRPDRRRPVDGARARHGVPPGVRRPGDGRYRRPGCCGAPTAGGLVGDIKTGASGRLRGARLVGSASCAAHAHSDLYDPTNDSRTPTPPLDKVAGIIIHLPAGRVACARCTSSTTGRRLPGGAVGQRGPLGAPGGPPVDRSRCLRTARRWTSSRASSSASSNSSSCATPIALLDDGQRAVLNAIAQEAHATVGSISAKVLPSRRRWLIACALVRWAAPRVGRGHRARRAGPRHRQRAVPSADRAARGDRRPVDHRPGHCALGDMALAISDGHWAGFYLPGTPGS